MVLLSSVLQILASLVVAAANVCALAMVAHKMMMIKVPTAADAAENLEDLSLDSEAPAL